MAQRRRKITTSSKDGMVVTAASSQSEKIKKDDDGSPEKADDVNLNEPVEERQERHRKRQEKMIAQFLTMALDSPDAQPFRRMLIRFAIQPSYRPGVDHQHFCYIEGKRALAIDILALAGLTIDELVR